PAQIGPDYEDERISVRIVKRLDQSGLNHRYLICLVPVQIGPDYQNEKNIVWTKPSLPDVGDITNIPL
ncbi:11437_t:CDS:2, partial [Ambispora leptoticha]